MKELSIEEKAKAYDRALKIAKSWCKLDNNDLSNDDLETLFPELKKFDDERIRKALIDGFTVMKESKNCGKTFSNHNIPVVDILAWLEKQAEVVSDKDDIEAEEKGIRKAFNKIWDEKQSEQKVSYTTLAETGNGGINALITKEITNGGDFESENCKQKPSWNEKDESHLIHCVRLINNAEGCSISEQENAIEWLKSLKEGYTWRPSDEQMRALENFIGTIPPYERMFQILKSLYNELKKLKRN